MSCTTGRLYALGGVEGVECGLVVVFYRRPGQGQKRPNLDPEWRALLAKGGNRPTQLSRNVY